MSTKTVNDYPLAYTDRGTGPTVVFVHGILVDYRWWQAPLSSWTADYRVVAISMRHFYPEKWNGKSSDFTVQQHAKDLTAFIESIGGPVHLVGWSYGGSPAYEVALARPDLVKKLVLVEGGPNLLAAPPGAPGNAVVIARAEKTEKILDAGDLDGGMKFAVDDINGPGFWDGLPEPRRQIIRDNAWTLIASAREVRNPAKCAEFESLKMPVLLVWGEITSPFSKTFVQEQSKCRPTSPVAMIPKAGHGSAAMNPSAFKEAVTTFLRD